MKEDRTVILALHNFDRGYNCAESTLLALSSKWDLRAQSSAATVFGGGIAGKRDACGALLGALIAVSLKVGKVGPDELELKERAGRLGKETIKKFSDTMGCYNCRDILDSMSLKKLGEDTTPESSKRGECRYALRAAVLAALSAVEEEQVKI